ncbi:MAG: molybdate ABC transporter substrate-binding protein [Gemmataceae bacterium]
MSLRWLSLGSALALGVLAWFLFREPSVKQPVKPLVVYCAAALKPAMQSVAAVYDRPIEFRFGNSEQILAQASIGGDGDLFLPADDSYVRTAQASGVATESFPLAKMRVVVLARPGNPRRIAKLEDLLQKGLKLGQANPDAAAIGRVTRAHLQKSGRWQELHANTLVFHTTVTDAANAVKLGSNDAAIVWDAVAANDPSLAVVKLPELEDAVGNVEIARLRSCTDSAAARRFVDFVKSEEHGKKAFRAAGFSELAP